MLGTSKSNSPTLQIKIPPPSLLSYSICILCGDFVGFEGKVGRVLKIDE